VASVYASLWATVVTRSGDIEPIVGDLQISFHFDQFDKVTHQLMTSHLHATWVPIARQQGAADVARKKWNSWLLSKCPFELPLINFVLL
jgi:hypothetical protein